jgi:hypothetical protein
MRSTLHPRRPATIAVFLALAAAVSHAASIAPAFLHEDAASWRFVEGDWRLSHGALTQRDASRGSAAILREPAFSDFTLTVDFRIQPEGNGVRAAAIIFRATGTLSYYWLHLDSKYRQVIFTRSTPDNTWIEIARKRVDLRDSVWHTARIEAKGKQFTVAIDGIEAMRAEDAAIAAGRVGLGTSQGAAEFRNLKVEGETTQMSDSLHEEALPYKVISRGTGPSPVSGSYQAFPDACRLRNGDILAVFYAGYGHISLPTPEWPRGGRICMVRSHDEGRTWSEPRILYDDENDNRDPHIAQLSDGTLICSFFSLARAENAAYRMIGCQIARSHDGGETWETTAQTVTDTNWACSAPVREMPDGTLILGVYRERGSDAWGGVIRSTDRGKTWSAPIPIGEGAGLPLDAETDVIRLKDGTLFAALRSSRVHMHYATSPDEGLTWSAVKDIGFPAHAPHLNRLKTGEILMAHRLPETALHVSRDEGRTWEGPYVIDHVIGAYPATVELKDGTVLAVYYEEGEGSAVRALRFRLKRDGIEVLPLR